MINWSTQFVFANAVTNTKAQLLHLIFEENVYFAGYKVNENKHFKFWVLLYLLKYVALLICEENDALTTTK